MASSREAYEKLSSYVERDDLSEFTATVYDEVVKFYETDPEVQEVDWELIKDNLVTVYPKRQGLIEEYIAQLPKAVSVPNLLAVYEAVKKDKIGYDIIQALAGNKEDQAKEGMEQYLSFKIEDQEEDETFNAVHPRKLKEYFEGTNVIPIYPLALNQRLRGGMPRQSSVCIYGRPNSGKTAFTINLVAGAAQNGYKVLHVCNEENTRKIIERVFCRFVKATPEEVALDLDKYYDIAMDKGYGRVYIRGTETGTLLELRTWVEKYKPDVLVVDQVRNVHVKGDHTATSSLETVMKGLRSIAKKHNLLAIGVTQAGDSATGKAFLTMEDIDSSKTGMQGATDLMLGIGQNADMRSMNKIMINVTKSKYTDLIEPFSATIDYAKNLVQA